MCFMVHSRAGRVFARYAGSCADFPCVGAPGRYAGGRSSIGSLTSEQTHESTGRRWPRTARPGNLSHDERCLNTPAPVLRERAEV